MKTTHTRMGYQICNGTLRRNLDESKHLMWSLGGVPCIDQELWHRHYRTHVNDPRQEFNRVEFPTNRGRVFRIWAEVFDGSKKEIDHGYGLQYYVESKLWLIASTGGEVIKANEPDPQMELF